jgi:ABC-type glycerol-3-phosphate transport system substrate-binding protein
VARFAPLPAAGAVLVACAAPAEPRPPGAALATADLTYLERGGPAYQELHQERAGVFMKLAPGARVTGEQMTGTTDEQLAKLVALAAGGTPPDLALHLDHAQTVRLAANGSVLAPLDAYLGRDRQLNLQDIHPEVQAQYRYQRRVYGVAHGISLTSLFVNLDLFRAAGVTPPAADWKDARWTVAALVDAAARLTRPGGRGGFEQAGIVAEQMTWNLNVGNWILGNGGAFLDDLEAPRRCVLDSPQTREVAELLVDLRQRRRVWADGEALEGLLPQQWFASGRAALYFGGSFKINALRAATTATADWDIAPLPRFKQPVVGLGGSGVSMLAGSKQQDAAWELLRFMVDADYNRLQAKAGLDTPARTSVLTGAEYLGEAPPPKSRTVIGDSVQYGRAKNIRALRGPEIETAFNQQAVALFDGAQSVGDFVSRTCAAVAPFLDR